MLTQLGGVSRRAFLPFVLERDENLAVLRAERGAVAKRQVILLRGNAEVVDDHLQVVRGNDGADLRFNRAKSVSGLLQPCATGSDHVQADLSGINGGEKIAANPRERNESAAEDDGKGRKDRRSMTERPSECVHIKAAET